MRSAERKDKINDIAEAKVRAECKGGLLLRDIERGQGERNDLTSSDDAKKLSPYQAALTDAGLRYDASHRWQVMSWLPADELETYFIKTNRHDVLFSLCDCLLKRC